MAISKLKPRKANEGRSIAAVLKDRLDYDKNPEKTEEIEGLGGFVQIVNLHPPLHARATPLQTGLDVHE